MFAFILIELNKEYQGSLYCGPVFLDKQFCTENSRWIHVPQNLIEALLQLTCCVEQLLLCYSIIWWGQRHMSAEGTPNAVSSVLSALQLRFKVSKLYSKFWQVTTNSNVLLYKLTKCEFMLGKAPEILMYCK